MRLQFDSSHYLAFVIHILGEWHKEHGTRRSAQSPAGKFGVAHDAYDAERTNIFRQIKAEMLIQGLFAVLEKSFHKGFIHDCDRRGGLVVSSSEVASPQNCHAKVRKIIGGDAVPG